jgi:hypothetical protein
VKLFLSYPSAERAFAERLALALEAEGHEVFFDRSDLAAGGPFHQPLREAIEGADAMVFVVTPASVAAGSYTLAELDIARHRWRRPAGHVLPVMVQPTPMATLPPYLSAVTVLQPRGEAVAETVAAATRLPAAVRRKQRMVFAILAVVLMVTSGFLAWQWQQRRDEAAAAAAARATAQQTLQLCQDGNPAAALQQLATLVAQRPAQAELATLHEDCAMAWLREMRARSGAGVAPLTFDEQVRVTEPVLLKGLATAQGPRAADLRAHLGWGEALRRREGLGSDPLPHWQRALAEDPGNTFANAMLAHWLMPRRLDEARAHFTKALMSGRERVFVRRLQLGSALTGDEAARHYGIEMADHMRRGQEPLSDEQRRRLWSYAFAGLQYRSAREALLAQLPADAALATFDWAFAAADTANTSHGWSSPVARFVRAALQAQAGQVDAAQAGFEALLADHANPRTRLALSLLEEVRRELAALRRR